MWNKRTPFFLFTALLLTSAPAFAQPVTEAPKPQTQTAQSIRIEGKIYDARSGAPLTGVYVRQKEALNSGFSNAEGQFSLELQSGFAPLVMFQAEGYETVVLPFAASQTKLVINLQPLREFTSDLPPAHSDTTPKRYDRIFGPQFTLFYQGNFTLFRQNDVSINGIVLNEFGLSTDLMPIESLVMRGRFFRSRQPVDVANFDASPAFFINHQQAKIGFGTVTKLDGPMELFLGGDVMFDNRSPDNRNNQDQQPVRFTGTLLDLEQTRIGLGLNAALGWEINDQLALFPEITVYPVMGNFVSSTNPHYMVAGDIGAKLRFEIIPGLYAVGSYNTQLWYSFGPNAFENNHFLHIGLSVDPWALAERLQ